MEEQLALRDIHLPEAIGIWPPAPGWWLVPLLLLALLAVLYLLYRVYRRITRKTVYGQVAKLLNEIAENSEVDNLQKTRALSKILRRAAMSIDYSSDVAGLSGEAWLKYLDQSIPGEAFSAGAGRLLIEAPYRNILPQAADVTALLGLCRQWLEAQK